MHKVPALNNHLCDALSAQGLAADKGLTLDTGQEVADGRQEQEHSGRDQARLRADTADELDDGHDAIGGGAHVVGGDLANEVVELSRGRADAQQERDFDEQDQECRRPNFPGQRAAKLHRR